ncbi:MAG: MFS transporter [Pseudomonadota bacterium]
MYQLALGDRCFFVLVFSSGLLAYYLLPVWFTLLSDHHGFSLSEVGVLLSVDLAFGTLASFASRFWISRLNWRAVASITIVGAAMANFACIGLENFTAFFVLRGLAGFFSGSMMALAYAGFAQTAEPAREFGLAMASQIALGAAALYGTTWLIGYQYEDGAFALAGILTAMPLLFYRFCPLRNPVLAIEKPSGTRATLRVCLALFSMTLFMCTLTGVWTLLEVIGDMGGFEPITVGKLLSVSLVFSFLGALFTSFRPSGLSLRLGIAGGYLALVIALFLLGLESLLLYGLAVMVYNFFFSFVMPLQCEWIAQSDDAGLNAVLVPVAQGLGATAGPFIASVLLQQFSLSVFLITSVFLLIISFSIFAVLGPSLAHGARSTR